MFTRTIHSLLQVTVRRIVVLVSSVALLFGVVASPAHAGDGEAAASLPSSAFMNVDEHGAPARWDPCAPLRWKLLPTGIPRGGKRAVLLAVRQLKSATGLNFVYAGHATAAEFAHPPAQTLVIGFTSAMAPTRAGTTRNSLGGGPNGSLVILNSQVKINRRVAHRPGQRFSEMLPTLIHELGHAVGIAHAHSPREVMNPFVVPVYTYQRGDRVKLAAVGSSNGCHPILG